MNKPMKFITESGKEVILPPTWPPHSAINLPPPVYEAYRRYGRERMFNNIFWTEWENMSDEELAKQGIVRDSTRDPPYNQPNIADPFDPDNGWLPIPEAWKKMGLYFTAKAGPAVGRLPPGLCIRGGGTLAASNAGGTTLAPFLVQEDGEGAPS